MKRFIHTTRVEDSELYLKKRNILVKNIRARIKLKPKTLSAFKEEEKSMCFGNPRRTFHNVQSQCEQTKTQASTDLGGLRPLPADGHQDGLGGGAGGGGGGAAGHGQGPALTVAARGPAGIVTAPPDDGRLPAGRSEDRKEEKGRSG